MNLVVPIMGNMSRTALIALRLIKRLSFIPSQETLTKDNSTRELPGTVRQMMRKSAAINKRTHRRCMKMKEKGILEEKTRMSARTNPRKAPLKSCTSTTETMSAVRETILTLGSQECRGDARWANLSISGRCMFLAFLFAHKIKDDSHDTKDVANPADNFGDGYSPLLHFGQLSHNRLQFFIKRCVYDFPNLV